jgi:hypothetical protein
LDAKYGDALCRSATDAGIWEPWLRRREARKRAKAGQGSTGHPG